MWDFPVKRKGYPPTKKQRSEMIAQSKLAAKRRKERHDLMNRIEVLERQVKKLLTSK